MRIPEAVITNIKNTALISDVISEYVPLKPRGQNYFGHCPFHNDKTPSFSVNNDKKLFHCFGCNKSGDVFKFLMEFKNISYPEAIREVAEKYGIKIESYNNEKLNEKAKYDDIILQINKIAAEKYSENLTKSSEGYKYLISRGLDEHDIHNFKLGYAPESWDFIYNYLKGKNYSDESLLASAVVSESKKARNPFDRFRKKIIFPIFNEKDNVIGFGSRVVDNSLPKYINSPETNVFNKKKVLYGINIAKNHFRDKKHAIITEGYFDVIACHKFGFNTAVATLGTSITVNHFYSLTRHKLKNIFLVFDPDEAGVKACLKAIRIGSDFDFSLKVITLEDGMDPMDFLLKNGRKAFMEKMDDALNPIDFVVNSSIPNFDMNNTDSRMGFVKHIFSFVRLLNNNILKDEFLKRLAEVTNIDEQSIREEFSKGIKPQRRVFKKDRVLENEKKLERNLLFVLLANEYLFTEYYNNIHFDFFKDDFCRKIYKAAVEKYKSVGNYDISIILNSIDSVLDLEEDKIYFSDEIFKDIYTNKPETQINLILKEIKMRQIDSKIAENLNNIKNVEKIGDETNLIALLEQQQILFNEKNKLNKAIQATEKF